MSYKDLLTLEFKPEVAELNGVICKAIINQAVKSESKRKIVFKAAMETGETIMDTANSFLKQITQKNFSDGTPV